MNFLIPDPLAIYSEGFCGRETRVSNDEPSANFRLDLFLNTTADDPMALQQIGIFQLKLLTSATFQPIWPVCIGFGRLLARLRLLLASFWHGFGRVLASFWPIYMVLYNLFGQFQPRQDIKFSSKFHDNRVHGKRVTNRCVNLNHGGVPFGSEDVFHFHRLDHTKLLPSLNLLTLLHK